MQIGKLNTLFLGSRAAKVNYGSRCEVGMPGPDPCSPLFVCDGHRQNMSNGTLCVRGCVCM